MLGLFTQVGCYGAFCMLGLFYLTAMPLDGAPHPGMEGEYMIVNRNLIELVAVAVLWSFRTGRIAGFDLLYYTWRSKPNASPAPQI
jgi:thiosulfate dehydrogenase [quinone] large subunit